MKNHRVVVTGMGVVSPVGIGLDAFEEGIRKGKSGISFDDEMKEYNFKCQLSARVPMSEDEIAKMNKSLRLVKMKSMSITFGMMAVKEAWEDAGFEFSSPHDQTDWDTGCIIGNEAPSADVIYWAAPHVLSGRVRKLGSMTVQQSQNSGIIGYVNRQLGLGNALYTVAQACATGSLAIGHAYERIRTGRARKMITGSSELQGKSIWAPFDSLMALNRQSNHEPSKGSSPMSVHATGLVPGSGAAMLILENLGDAQKRGARIYGEVMGAAGNSGGQRSPGSMTLPNPEGIKLCIEAALKEANIEKGDVDLISGHLTSTVADVTEIEAWTSALDRTGKDFPYINSLKSMVGHGFGAAGSMSALTTILQLHKGFVHPTLNSEELHPDIASKVDRSRIPLQTIEDVNLKTGIQASFGFGDLNACLVFKKLED